MRAAGPCPLAARPSAAAAPGFFLPLLCCTDFSTGLNFPGRAFPRASQLSSVSPYLIPTDTYVVLGKQVMKPESAAGYLPQVQCYFDTRLLSAPLSLCQKQMGSHGQMQQYSCFHVSPAYHGVPRGSPRVQSVLAFQKACCQSRAASPAFVPHSDPVQAS